MPTPSHDPADDDLVFRFADALSNDMAILACDHEDLLPPRSPEELAAEAEAEAESYAYIQGVMAGTITPRPRRELPPMTDGEHRAAHARLTIYRNTVRRLAAGDAEIERLLDAYDRGLSQDAARRRAGLDAATHLAALVRLYILIDDLPGPVVEDEDGG